MLQKTLLIASIQTKSFWVKLEKIKPTTAIMQNNRIKCNLLNNRSLSSKVVLVNEIISDYNIDLFHLTETWLVIKNMLAINPKAKLNYKSFESFVLSFSHQTF